MKQKDITKTSASNFLRLPLLLLFALLRDDPKMPRSYPPYSTQRHSTHNPSDRRSHSGSRERQVRSSRFLAHNNGNNGQRESRGKWPRLRTHLVAMTAEFIGTVLFLWFAFAGTQVASMSNPSGSVLQPQGIVYISLSFGMSLLVVAWAMYRISGGLFNPAVRINQPTSAIQYTDINR